MGTFLKTTARMGHFIFRMRNNFFKALGLIAVAKIIREIVLKKKETHSLAKPRKRKQASLRVVGKENHGTPRRRHKTTHPYPGNLTKH